MLKTTLSTLLLVAAAALPLGAAAAGPNLTDRVGEIGYHLRVAEKCGVDASDLESIADTLGDEVASEADLTDGDRLAMASAVLKAAKRADADFPAVPPPVTCQQVVATLNSLL